jgi:hypothetical protein
MQPVGGRHRIVVEKCDDVAAAVLDSGVSGAGRSLLAAAFENRHAIQFGSCAFG